MLDINTYKDLFKKESSGFTGNFEKVKEHNIYYEIASNSETIERTFILSHGACGTGRFLKPVGFNLLKTIPNIRVIIVDLPLHGLSTTDVALDINDITVHTYSEVIYEFINILKIKNVIEGTLNWVGWSMGGSVGLLLDLKGAPIDELTLLNSSPIWESIAGILTFVPGLNDKDLIVDEFRGVVIAGIQDNNEEEFIDVIANNYDDIIPSAEIMVQDFKAILPNNYNVIPELSNIKANTLIISGTKDNLAEVKYQNLMNETISNSDLVLLDDDHSLLIIPYAVDIICESIINKFIK